MAHYMVIWLLFVLIVSTELDVEIETALCAHNDHIETTDISIHFTTIIIIGLCLIRFAAG